MAILKTGLSGGNSDAQDEIHRLLIKVKKCLDLGIFWDPKLVTPQQFCYDSYSLEVNRIGGRSLVVK